MSFHDNIWLYAGLLAALLALAVFAAAARARRRNLRAFASAKLLPELSRSFSPVKSHIKAALWILGVFAIFVALARPQYGYRWEEAKTKGVDVIFAIDVSKSMLAEDIVPNRMERAKLAVVDLSELLRGDRVGIVAFSGQAFLQCPLTLDYDAFRMSLDALDTNVIQRGGTNIASAITEAETAFNKTNSEKIIVLISDGEELESSAVRRAKEAAANGVKIYCLGIGGTKGEPITITDERGHSVKIRDEKGEIVRSRLNEKVLAEVAQTTGGFYRQLSTEAVNEIYTDGIAKATQTELDSRMKRLAIERFQIPLAIAIILLALETLIGTRRFFSTRGKLGAAAFFAGLLTLANPDSLQAQTAAQTAPQPQQTASAPAPNASPAAVKLDASEHPEQPDTAQKSEETREPPTAKTLFNTGVDRYVENKFDESKKLFENAMKMSAEDLKMHAKALYNIANAKYKTVVDSLLDAKLPREIRAQIAQFNGELAQIPDRSAALLREGAPLLEREKQMLAQAKTEDEKKAAMQGSPLKDQQFQQKLSQCISNIDALQKSGGGLNADVEKSSGAWNAAKADIDKISDIYGDSATLDNSLSDAHSNRAASLQTSANLAKQIAEFDDTKAQAHAYNQKLDANKENLDSLKKELQKLVRNDNNQNNQNQQNQQNQNNQQNQQQQNQDKNQQQSQNNKDNNSSQNKNDQQQNQNKDDKQNGSDNDNKPENRDNKQDKQNADKNNKNDGDPNKNEQAIDNQNRDKQKRDGQNGSPENSEKRKDKPEDAQSESPAKPENKGETKQPDTAEQAKPNEKPAPAQTAEQAAQKAASERDNFRKAEGVMTKAEAKQLLESMKDDQKILPLRGFGEQKQRYEQSYKDW